MVQAKALLSVSNSKTRIPRSGCSVRDLDANVVVVLREMREPPG